MTTPVAPVAPALKKTALNSTHRALKAKMVDFGGWDMPVEYPCPGGGLIAEHMAVRTGVGLFDVSHMGEIQFRGPGSLAAVQHITMNDAAGNVCRRHSCASFGRKRLPAGGECGNEGQRLRVDSAECGCDAVDPSQRLLKLLFATGAAGAARAVNTAEADQSRPGGNQELLVHLWTSSRDQQCADCAHRLLGRRRV